MERKIGVIGYGSMGKMIFSKLVQSNVVDEYNLFVANRTFEKIIDLHKTYPKTTICRNNCDLAKEVDILFMCVKPLEIRVVLTEIINEIKNSCHIISLNGSVLFKQLEQMCVNKKISKVIPSVTAEANQSVTLVCHNNFVEDEDKNYLKTMLECFGTTIEIPETEIGMGAELTSCMPGFIGAIFEIIACEAEKHTAMNKNSIVKMIIETIYGTGKLLLEKEMSFDNIISRVATKGGITEEGTKVIEEKLPDIIHEMFEKTLEKRKITTEKAQKEFMG
jgi:pyrroline-5-carboxylate reductase